MEIIFDENRWSQPVEIGMAKTRMNHFGLAVAALQLAAAVEAVVRRDYTQALIYAGFSVGSLGVAIR